MGGLLGQHGQLPSSNFGGRMGLEKEVAQLRREVQGSYVVAGGEMVGLVDREMSHGRLIEGGNGRGSPVAGYAGTYECPSGVTGGDAGHRSLGQT